MGQINYQDDSKSQSLETARTLVREIVKPEEVIALLSSRQMDVVYAIGYRGSDEEIMTILQRCEEFCANLMQAPHTSRLELGVVFLDAALLTSHPAQEVRNLIQTIIRKDPELIKHMPQLQLLLKRILRAVELSMIFNQSVLDRLIADIGAQNQLVGIVNE